MPKWKIVSTKPIQLLSSAFDLQYISVVDDAGPCIISVAGIPFKEIPDTSRVHDPRALGRYNNMIAIRSDITIDDFDVEIVNEP